MRGYIKQFTNKIGVKRTEFVSNVGMCYVWYHGAWRFVKELDALSYVHFARNAIFCGWLRVSEIKWNRSRFMHIRVALDPIDYEYHQYNCKRFRFSIARRDFEEKYMRE